MKYAEIRLHRAMTLPGKSPTDRFLDVEATPEIHAYVIGDLEIPHPAVAWAKRAPSPEAPKPVSKRVK